MILQSSMLGTQAMRDAIGLSLKGLERFSWQFCMTKIKPLTLTYFEE